MSKYITSIPLGDIERIKIYINSGKLPLRQIVAQEAPDLAITGNFWLYETYRPTCPIKADGKVLATDTYHYPALIWDTGPDISMGIVPPGGACGKANYIANSAGLHLGKPETMYCKADVRGRRGRTGWGFCGGALAFIAFPDGSDGMEPEELRDYVQGLGWSDFIMGDGGRKVNYYNRATGDMVQGRDPSQNLILVYKRKRAPSEPDDSDKEDKPMSTKYTVCLDPGHGPDTVNGSPDGSYKEREFAWDMYTRIRPLLERHGVNVICTRTEDTKPSLTARCEVSNRAGADLFVSLHSNAEGVSGWGTTRGLLVYTSSGPMTAKRNVAATAIVNRAHEAGVLLHGSGVAHQIEYTVLAKTDAPAVLIEYGYHTTREDVDLLKNSSYRDKLAEATAKGVCDFLGIAWTAESGVDGTDTPAADWAAEAWQKAKSNGVMDGTRPTDPVTRQELALVLNRLNLI